MSANASCRSKYRQPRARASCPGAAAPPGERARKAALALALALGVAPAAALAQGAPAPPPDLTTPAATAAPSAAPPPSPAEAGPAAHAPPATPTRPAPNPTGAFGRTPNTAQLSSAALSRGKGPPLAWDPAWPTFRTSEYFIAVAGFATSITSQIARPRAAHWRGGILFDEAFRDLARPGAYYARQTAEDASDVLVSFLISYPLVVDTLGVAWWHRGSDEVATQMALINAETYAVSLGLQSLTTVIGSRERPYGRTCGAGLDAISVDCTASNRYRSYFSGHTSMAFTGAALTCTHHAYLHLYGGGAPDTVACAGGLVLAGLTGFFRIMGDRHYASDVLSGALVGSATGFLVPWLLHYRGGASPAGAKKKGAAGPSLYPIASPGLFGVGGSFL